jgi:hypothetical protein
MKPEQIRANLNRRVRCRSAKTGIDAEYILTGAIFRRGKHGLFYQAELQDQRQSKSILICNLEEIEPATE